MPHGRPSAARRDGAGVVVMRSHEEILRDRFLENLEAERVTHSHESLAQVKRRLERERPLSPYQIWYQKAQEATHGTSNR